MGCDRDSTLAAPGKVRLLVMGWLDYRARPELRRPSKLLSRQPVDFTEHSMVTSSQNFERTKSSDQFLSGQSFERIDLKPISLCGLQELILHS